MSNNDNYEEQVELREQEAYNADMIEAGREADRVQSEHDAYVAELEARIAELEAEIQEYRCLCEDWALVETDDSIKLAMIEASKPEVQE